MPIPANQITDAEIIVHGQIAAGGSTTVNTQNVFHLRRTAVVFAPGKAGLDTAFDAAVAAIIVLAMNNRWSQLFNTVRWINDAQDAPTQFAHVNAGAVAGDSQTTINWAYMKFRTALKGKSYRGGKHLGPLSEADTTAGTEDILNAAALVRFGNVATALATPIVDAAGNIWLLEIVSRTLSQMAVNPTTIVKADVTAILVNKRIGRSKRREVKSVY